jgi:hypothetical protein
MKKIIGFILIVLALSAVTQPLQAQTVPISAATPVMVKTFEIDTCKAASVDTLCIFYVPYSMNVIGLVATAAGVDTTISASHATTGVDSIVLYRFYPLTNIASTVIAQLHLCVSNIEVTASPTTPAIGHLVIGAYYKLKIQVSTNGHLYRPRIEIHYTR